MGGKAAQLRAISATAAEVAEETIRSSALHRLRFTSPCEAVRRWKQRPARWHRAPWNKRLRAPAPRSHTGPDKQMHPVASAMKFVFP